MPQTASTLFSRLHFCEQPSPLALLPSSHCSLPSRMWLPQTATGPGLPAEVGSGARDDELAIEEDEDDVVEEEDSDVTELDDELVDEELVDDKLLTELRGLELETAPLPLVVPPVVPLPVPVPVPMLVINEDDALVLEDDETDEDEEELVVLWDEDDVVEDDTALLLEDEDRPLPQAGLKTHLQPPVQFSPSSSQAGASQPRPQLGTT